MLAAHHEKAITVNDQPPHFLLSINCKSDYIAEIRKWNTVQYFLIAVIVMQIILIFGKIKFAELLAYVDLKHVLNLERVSICFCEGSLRTPDGNLTWH